MFDMYCYDLAVWEGSAPQGNREALATYAEMYDKYMDEGYPTDVTPAVRTYVQTLLGRWPGLSDVDAS